MAGAPRPELSCAICKEPVPDKADNKAFPFCSHRCQMIDLGHWLDGDYRLSDEAVDRDFRRRGD